MAWQPTTPLAHAVFEAGFEYDGKRDIIYSRLYPLQRHTGFCWAYDCLSPAMLMIIDCEPFYFGYDGKLWMIELWKGQYGIETGAEIGVYNCMRDKQAPTVTAGRFSTGARGTFFNSATDSEMPTMAFKLSRDGSPLLERGPERHWWLTGFKWGVFTRSSSQLSMDIQITFDNKPEMCSAFKGALKERGYPVREIGNTGVGFVFNRPTELQPASRWAAESGAQATNERLVNGYIALKKALNLPSNDPNGFVVPAQWLDAAQQVVDKAAKLRNETLAAAKVLQDRASAMANKLQGTFSVASRLQTEAAAAAKRHQEQAAALAKKIQSGVSGAANKIEDKISGETTIAYRDIAAFFERNAWHGPSVRR